MLLLLGNYGWSSSRKHIVVPDKPIPKMLAVEEHKFPFPDKDKDKEHFQHV